MRHCNSFYSVRLRNAFFSMLPNHQKHYRIRCIFSSILQAFHKSHAITRDPSSLLGPLLRLNCLPGALDSHDRRLQARPAPAVPLQQVELEGQCQGVKTWWITDVSRLAVPFVTHLPRLSRAQLNNMSLSPGGWPRCISPSEQDSAQEILRFYRVIFLLPALNKRKLDSLCFS